MMSGFPLHLKIARFRMKSSKRMKALSGNIDTVRAKRELMRKALHSIRAKAIEEFREKNPPSASESDEPETISGLGTSFFTRYVE